MPSNAVIDPASLPERRRDVLNLVLEGLPNKQIARRLGLAEVTVKTHVRLLLRDFGVHSRTELIVTAARAGLVPCARCRQREVARG